ncbi:hypothetical protein [Gaetbulibacter saemankumensis]|uniref:hypothetical protein n=1 Tax=Gaetbulibacter saemankumensis TaxID=311208 RepID=UPI00040BE156|nr:hypothetical protein [Gaetbulibacter saemankumensis]
MEAKDLISKIKDITLYVPLDLNHYTYIYASVFKFAETYNLNVKIKYKNFNARGRISVLNHVMEVSNSVYRKVFYVKLSFKDNTPNKILAFDLDDIPYYFSEHCFRHADVVFKRNFIQEYISVLPDTFKGKLRPLGVSYKLKPAQSFSIRFKGLFLYSKFRHEFKLDCFFLMRIQSLFKSSLMAFQRLNQAKSEHLFNEYHVPDNTNIFYQKRFFKQVNSQDIKDVHGQRVRVIRLLKQHFPKYFKGGLKRDVYVAKAYNDCFSNIGSEQEFIEASRASGISVYTRGIAQSVGWSLPELMAQSRCIVAEKITNTLPFNLIEGKDILFFENETNLISILEQLIRDKEQVKRIGSHARKTFETYMSTDVFFENALTQI